LLCIHLHQERNQSVRYVAGERIKVSKPLADTRLNGVTRLIPSVTFRKLRKVAASLGYHKK
jgi:hypothetical protein